VEEEEEVMKNRDLAEQLVHAIAHMKFGPKLGLPWDAQRGIDIIRNLVSGLVDGNELHRLQVEVARSMDKPELPEWDGLEDDLIFVDGRWAFPKDKTDRVAHVLPLANQIRRQSGLPEVDVEE
jgi:hypothetical protein